MIYNDLLNDNYLMITVTYDGSQLSSGFSAYINGVEAEAFPVDTGALSPAAVTIPTFYAQGQAVIVAPVFGTHIWKIRNWTIHDRVLSGLEIRTMHADPANIPAAGLYRNYQMGTLSPSFPVNPEVIYETVNDLNFANLENHSNARTPF